jgi:hypothetical protein
MSFENLSGDITVYGLSISLGQPAVSSNKQYIEIPYKGVTDPSSNTVVMSKYQYSLDNGATYSDMTPVSASDTSNLSFSDSGSLLTFRWDAKKDLGADLYNKSIKIVLQATEFGLTSTEVSRSFYFQRNLTNVAAERAKKPFPDSYDGISGSKYKQDKLPRVN